MSRRLCRFSHIFWRILALDRDEWKIKGRHLLNNGTWKWPQQKNIFNTIKTVNRHPQFLTCILLNSGVALQSGSLSRSSYSSSSSSVISMVSTFLSSSAPSFFADRLLAFFPAVRSSSSSSASFFCNYKTCWIWFTWKLPPRKLDNLLELSGNKMSCDLKCTIAEMLDSLC